MQYKIYPIHFGTSSVDRSQFEYRHPVGERIPSEFGCFAIKSDTETILFDSGIPQQDEIRRIGLHFGFMDDAPDIRECFLKAGVVPEEVSAIVLSHLHWDHSWNLDMFPNAKIYVQRKEMQHAIAPMPHERSAYTLSQGVEGCPGWLVGLNRMVPVDGDFELRPGLKMITTPGHTVGSQSLMVDTAEGLYALVSDLCLTDACWEECIVTGIFYDAQAWYDSYNKVRAYNPKVITTHSTRTYEKKVYG